MIAALRLPALPARSSTCNANAQRLQPTDGRYSRSCSCRSQLPLWGLLLPSHTHLLPSALAATAHLAAAASGRTAAALAAAQPTLATLAAAHAAQSATAAATSATGAIDAATVAAAAFAASSTDDADAALDPKRERGLLARLQLCVGRVPRLLRSGRRLLPAGL